MTRIPAAALEELIEDRLARWTDDANDDAWAELDQNAKQTRLREHVRRIEVGIEEVSIEIPAANARESAHWKQAVDNTGDTSVRGKHGMRVAVSIRLRKRGGETIITTRNGESLLNRPLPNVGLIKNLVTAFRWREQLARGEADSIAAIADTHSCTERYVRKILPLAFLAPDIIESILDGVQPRMLTLDDLTTAPAPLDWTRQRTAFGFTGVAES